MSELQSSPGPIFRGHPGEGKKGGRGKEKRRETGKRKRRERRLEGWRRRGRGWGEFLASYPPLIPVFLLTQDMLPCLLTHLFNISDWKMTWNGCYTGYPYHFLWNKHLRNSIHSMSVWVHTVYSMFLLYWGLFIQYRHSQCHKSECIGFEEH